MNEWRIGQPNRSYSYILPMIGETIMEFRGKVPPMNNFRACFIANEDLPDKNSHIFLLYKFSSSPEFVDFEARILQYPNCIDSYDPDEDHVIYTFEIPDKWLENYNLFLESKYSKMSDEYKRHIIKFHELKPNTSVVGTLYRKEFRYKQLEKDLGIEIPRDQEASSILDFSIETFSKDMLGYTVDI